MEAEEGRGPRLGGRKWWQVGDLLLPSQRLAGGTAVTAAAAAGSILHLTTRGPQPPLPASQSYQSKLIFTTSRTLTSHVTRNEKLSPGVIQPFSNTGLLFNT